MRRGSWLPVKRIGSRCGEGHLKKGMLMIAIVGCRTMDRPIPLSRRIVLPQFKDYMKCRDIGVGALAHRHARTGRRPDEKHAAQCKEVL